MRLTDGLCSIVAVEGLGTDRAYIMCIAEACRHKRLTAAVDAAARAAHDLDEVVVLLAALDSIKKLSCIAKARSNCDVDGHAGHIIGCLLDAFCTTNLCEFNSLKFFTCQSLNCCTKSCLHNAAGCAEDDSRAGGFAERVIKGLFRKVIEADRHLLDHAGQLSGCDRDIDIRIAGSALVFSADLKLLGCTRHDADADDLGRVNTHLLCIVGLQCCAEHLLRRLTG